MNKKKLVFGFVISALFFALVVIICSFLSLSFFRSLPSIYLKMATNKQRSKQANYSLEFKSKKFKSVFYRMNNKQRYIYTDLLTNKVKLDNILVGRESKLVFYNQNENQYNINTSKYKEASKYPIIGSFSYLPTIGRGNKYEFIEEKQLLNGQINCSVWRQKNDKLPQGTFEREICINEDMGILLYSKQIKPKTSSESDFELVKFEKGNVQEKDFIIPEYK